MVAGQVHAGSLSARAAQLRICALEGFRGVGPTKRRTRAQDVDACLSFGLLLNDVAAASGSTSNVFSILPAYFGSDGSIRYDIERRRYQRTGCSGRVNPASTAGQPA